MNTNRAATLRAKEDEMTEIDVKLEAPEATKERRRIMRVLREHSYRANDGARLNSQKLDDVLKWIGVPADVASEQAKQVR